MREHLEALCALQNIDNDIKSTHGSQDDLSEQLAALRAGLELLGNELARQETEIGDTHKLRREHEAALKALEEACARSKIRLTGVKKPQEYMAIQRELENARKGIAGKEEEILKILEVEDAMHGAIDERRSRLEELRKAASTFEVTYGDRMATVDEKLSELLAWREETLERLPQRLVRQYERIRKARDGVALAEAQNETCTVCYIGIPPQLYNELQRGDVLATCPSCNRILYHVTAAAKEEEPAEG